MAPDDDGTHVEVDVPDTTADTTATDTGDTVVVVTDDGSDDNQTELDHERRITELEGRVTAVESRLGNAEMAASDAEATADTALGVATDTQQVIEQAIVEENAETDGDGDGLQLPEVPAVQDTLDEIVPRRTPLFFRKMGEFRR